MKLKSHWQDRCANPPSAAHITTPNPQYFHERYLVIIGSMASTNPDFCNELRT